MSDRRVLENCPICYESFDNRTTAIPCLHEFCKDCLGHWLEQPGGRCCPSCRQVVDSLRHSYTENGEFETTELMPSLNALPLDNDGDDDHGGPPPHVTKRTVMIHTYVELYSEGRKEDCLALEAELFRTTPDLGQEGVDWTMDDFHQQRAKAYEDALEYCNGDHERVDDRLRNRIIYHYQLMECLSFGEEIEESERRQWYEDFGLPVPPRRISGL